MPKEKRLVTDEMIIQYKPMVESWLAKSVRKNWNEAEMGSKYGKDEIIRQYSNPEVCIL